MVAIDISFDDGHELDMLTMDMLKRYDLTGIFFIPIQSWGFDHLKAYDGFQVGCHTYSHPSDLKLISDEALEFEIFGAKEILERELKQSLEWFCPPRGRGGEREICVAKAAGFDFWRSTKVGCTDLGPFVVDTSVHLYQRTEYGTTPMFNYALDKLGEALEKQQGYFHLWGHSEEINRYNLWGDFENILRAISKVL